MKKILLLVLSSCCCTALHNFRAHAALRKTLVNKLSKDDIIELTLTKPLGLVLKESDDKIGVTVEEILESGSASKSGKVFAGMKLISLNGENFYDAGFDRVMDFITSIPDGSSIKMLFKTNDTEQRSLNTTGMISVSKCRLTVVDRRGSRSEIDANIGDNLRKVLLSNKFDVYQGLTKLTNCNGAGQCGTCVVKIDARGWRRRSDYETKKLKNRSDSHRLSCQTAIDGDAVIFLSPAASDQS